MTQKRFKKLLMGHGYTAGSVNALVAYMKELRQNIQNGESVVLLSDAESMEFKPVKIRPYAETYWRILEGREFLA